MPLLTGSWKATVNGTEGELKIDSVDATGHVSGTLVLPGMPSGPGLEKIGGLWDEAASALTFSWLNGAVVFSGYHFESPSSPAGGKDVAHTLTGNCVTTGGGLAAIQATARRHHFGWVAQITQVV
jgi:hypothetical protein